MMTKTEMRKLYKEKRASLTSSAVSQLSEKIQDAFLASDLYKNARQIMLYMPIKNEVCTKKIIDAAKACEKMLVFPSTDPKTFEITPVLWDKECEFSQGTFSVEVPTLTKIADMTKSDVIVVPGIAFDKSGNRIGFGKGCYDRLLATSPAIKVGFCYDFQIARIIPADETDIKMDYLLCESGWVKCKEE